MAHPPALAGVGVKLRPLGPGDIEMVRCWRNRDDVRHRFKNAALISPEAQRDWFASYCARTDDFVWVIEDARTPGQAVGLISVYGRDDDRREAELGRIMAAPEARGGGHMAPACRAVIRHCFDALALDALALEVFADNAEALRLYRRCGFRVVDESGPLLRLRLERSWPAASRSSRPPHPARTVWLASYPKSGNTWLRIFLANLLYPDKAPVDINAMPLQTPISAGRWEFDTALGVPSADMLAHEIDSLRPHADRIMAERWPDPLLMRKAHDAYTYLPDGRPLMGRAPDYAALYVVRDPWDVAASYANHWEMTPDAAAGHLLRSESTLALSRRSLDTQLAQRISSWEEHVAGWMAAPMPVHVMRYGNMRRQPLRCFRAALRFLGFDHDDRAIEAALDAARFDRLQKQEAKSGFQEAPAGRQFFRSGQSGSGAAVLTAENLAALKAAHARVEALLQAGGW